MLRCTSCSAPLQGNNPRCGYCGTVNDIDSLKIREVIYSKESRKCPRCSTGMKTVNVAQSGNLLIERCDTCKGLFFDNGELECLLNNKSEVPFKINLEKLTRFSEKLILQERVSYVPCPVCEKLMNRENFGARSGVVIDRCSEHGIWLDGGELSRISEWRRAGGQLYHEKMIQERKKRLERKNCASGKNSNPAKEIMSYMVKSQFSTSSDKKNKFLHAFFRLISCF